MTLKSFTNCMFALLLLMLFQSQAKSQSFSYQHWEEPQNPFTCEIVKDFNPPTSAPFPRQTLENPVLWFKHTRGGHTDTTWNIDYIADDGREFQTNIEIPMPGSDSILHPRFYHFWRNHSGGGHLDTLMFVKGEKDAVYRIELQPMTIQDYKSKTTPAKVKITLVRAGNGGGGGSGGGTQWSEEHRTICAGTPIPSGWIIERREPCFSCPSSPGSACLQSVIVNLNGAPAGYEKWVCPGSTVPTGWAIIGQQLCVGACGDQAGSTCVQQKIKNLSGMPAGSQVALCPGSHVPAGWRKIGTQNCGGTCADRAGQACIMTICQK